MIHQINLDPHFYSKIGQDGLSNKLVLTLLHPLHTPPPILPLVVLLLLDCT